MKFFLQIVATFAVCGLLGYFLPWWVVAIGAAAVAYVVNNKGFVSFAAGFLGVALLWIAVAAMIDHNNHSILTQKINLLLPLNSFVLTACIGGLVGGFAALTGSLLKSRR